MEKEFVEYFRLISNGKSCWEKEGCWFFRPENVVYGTLNLVDKNIAGEVNTKKGTFNRSIAQKKEILNFLLLVIHFLTLLFHLLIIQYLDQHLLLRLKRKMVTTSVFKIIYKVKISSELYENFPSIVNTIESLFDEFEYVDIINVSGDLNLLENEEILKDLNYEKDNFERDLNKDEINDLLINVQDEYKNIINNIFNNKIEEVHNIFYQKIEPKIIQEKQKIERNCEFLKNFYGDMYEDEISTWTNFADNLSKWKTTVKSFGLISSEIP